MNHLNNSSFTVDRRSTQLRKLTEISRALTYTVSLAEVLDLTVTHAAALLDAERAVLMLNEDNGFPLIRSSYGIDSEALKDFSEPLHETLITRLQTLLATASEQQVLAVPLVVGGEVTGLLAVACTISDVHLEEMEWLLSALADQAAVAIEKNRLDQTAEFRERLIGIVSHDLRNPIAVISMAATMLRRWEQLDSSVINKFLDRIESAAQGASGMISDLLDFTQARLGGGIPIHPKEADLHAIVRNIVDEKEVSHPYRQISASYYGIAKGVWDEDRLKQAIGNLLSNAISYSPTESCILIDVSGSDEWITVSIHNEGSAIEEDKMKNLFEPMQRASESVTNLHRSVGLGLYIVKHIVEAHGGDVGVISSADCGTTFSIRLPFVSQSRK